MYFSQEKKVEKSDMRKRMEELNIDENYIAHHIMLPSNIVRRIIDNDAIISNIYMIKILKLLKMEHKD